MPHLSISRKARVGISFVNFSLLHLFFRPEAIGLTALLLSACGLTGCSPTINLATPEPVKVDVNVRLDVYQKTAPTKANEEQSSLQIAKNRRLRAPQIQQLKVAGVLGEDRNGYLAIKNAPTDPKALAADQALVEAENGDRSFLYLANAQAQNKPLELVERDYAQLWDERAYPGQWIQKENGTWTQK